MKVRTWAWECEVCHFRWLIQFRFPKLRGRRLMRDAIVPEQCPSSYCRSREWNGKKQAGRPRKAVEDSQTGVTA